LFGLVSSPDITKPASGLQIAGNQLSTQKREGKAMINAVFKLRDKPNTHLGWEYIKIVDRYCYGWEEIPAEETHDKKAWTVKRFTYVILGWDTGKPKDLHPISDDEMEDLWMNYDFVEMEN
jgi:hypothetical protein